MGYGIMTSLRPCSSVRVHAFSTSDERNRFDINPNLIAGSEIHELFERLGQDTQ